MFTRVSWDFSTLYTPTNKNMARIKSELALNGLMDTYMIVKILLSKQCDLIDMFNGTFRYLDDIFTIDNPEFEGQKKPFFPWFTYKSNWQWCSYQRLRKTRWLRIPNVNLPWLSGDVPRLQSYGVYISQLVSLLAVALAFRISILKIFKLLPND